MSRQLSFDLKFVKLLGWKDFYTSPSNVDALKWICGFENAPTSILIIHGPKFSGKSHIGRLWAVDNNAYQLTLKDSSHRPYDIFERSKCFWVDGANSLISNQEWAFHFINFIISSKKKLLITDTLPATAWNIPLKDLKSRMLIAPSIRIKDPDDKLMLNISEKLLKEIGIVLPSKKLEKYLSLIDRTYESIHELVESLKESTIKRSQ